MTTIIKKRTSECNECISKKKLTPAQLACKRFWEQLKYEACRTQGGCPTPECTEKGLASWPVLQADHVGPKVRLSHYIWWASHGGVEAMKAGQERSVHLRMLYQICRRVARASSARDDGAVEIQRRPCEEAGPVNDKLAIGKCQYQIALASSRARPCAEADHRDERTKPPHETMPKYIKDQSIADLTHVHSRQRTRASSLRTHPRCRDG